LRRTTPACPWYITCVAIFTGRPVCVRAGMQRSVELFFSLPWDVFSCALARWCFFLHADGVLFFSALDPNKSPTNYNKLQRGGGSANCLSTSVPRFATCAAQAPRPRAARAITLRPSLVSSSSPTRR